MVTLQEKSRNPRLIGLGNLEVVISKYGLIWLINTFPSSSSYRDHSLILEVRNKSLHDDFLNLGDCCNGFTSRVSFPFTMAFRGTDVKKPLTGISASIHCSLVTQPPMGPMGPETS